MSQFIEKGTRGAEVKQLQQLLNERGYPVRVDGDFGPKTYRAVRAFQSQNLDQHGQPLVVDGKVGPITWWSLTHPKPSIVPPSAVDYLKMPPKELDGSKIGRAALAAAINEMRKGAREIGGNNRGPWVKIYLNGLAPEGSSWCAAFVSWCFAQQATTMPFQYTVGARDLLRQCKKNGWAYPPESNYAPQPGDLVVWWREKASGWMGHVGLVHQLRDGMLYTIEGNKSSKVQGFSYVSSRMEKLLGLGHVPNADS